MKTECDRYWEIDALREGKLGEGDADAFERHASACEVCSAAVARDARLRTLAASIAGVGPNDLDLRRTRARVLRDVANRRPQAWRAPVVIAASCAAAVVIALSWIGSRRAPLAHLPPPAVAPVAAGSGPEPPPPEPAATTLAGTVLSADGARWFRTRDAGVERIRLEEGTLRLSVRHQTAAERFVVELPDGELEVRGTTFTVSASATATARVAVEGGVVALRIRGLPAEILLQAGESWSAAATKVPPRAAPAAVSSAGGGRVRPSAAVATSTAIGAPAPSEDEGAEAYAGAIVQWQRHDYAAAAGAFHAFILSHPSASQVEDASFLEAAALARAGRSDAAALAAEDHLARFPSSFHRREAAILVARAARDRGDCAQARAILAPWLGSPPDAEARDAVGPCPGAATTHN
jgi:TolA-binding protein